MSELTRGAQPQTLVSNITNSFHFDVNQEMYGVGDANEVARSAVSSMRDMFQEGLERSTRTVQVVYAR